MMYSTFCAGLFLLLAKDEHATAGVCALFQKVHLIWENVMSRFYPRVSSSLGCHSDFLI